MIVNKKDVFDKYDLFFLKGGVFFNFVNLNYFVFKFWNLWGFFFFFVEVL